MASEITVWESISANLSSKEAKSGASYECFWISPFGEARCCAINRSRFAPPSRYEAASPSESIFCALRL